MESLPHFDWKTAEKPRKTACQRSSAVASGTTGLICTIRQRRLTGWRLVRASSESPSDARLDAIHRAIQILGGPGPNRAEQIQLIFSRTYSPGWKEELGLTVNG